MTRKSKEVPEYKLALLEHIMLEQFNGPDEFYPAIDLIIERWAAEEEA